MYLLFFALWVIFNGAFSLEICLFGVVVAAAMFWFVCKFMDYSLAQEKTIYLRIGKMLHYVYILVMEIMKANLAVVHMILSEREEPKPVLVHFDTDMQTPTGRAFLANAITLTPGTITVTLEDSDYMVHCLDESLAEGIDRSVFVDLLKDLER